MPEADPFGSLIRVPGRHRGLTAVLVGMLLAHAGTVPAADFHEGLRAFDAGDYAAAVAEWRPLAKAGHVSAQVALAGLYAEGTGLPRDHSAAAYWYRQAAEAGDAIAQLNLGDYYARGLGVPTDRTEAFAWLTLAAWQGNLWARDRRDGLAAEMSPAQVTIGQHRAEALRSLRR